MQDSFHLWDRLRKGRWEIDVFLQDCSGRRILDNFNVDDVNRFLSSGQKIVIHVARKC